MMMIGYWLFVEYHSPQLVSDSMQFKYMLVPPLVAGRPRRVTCRFQARMTKIHSIYHKSFVDDESGSPQKCRTFPTASFEKP